MDQSNTPQNLDLGNDIPPNWDDVAYLKMYPDVAAAVQDGTVISGYAHFVSFGLWEGRTPAIKSNSFKRNLWPWSDELYLNANPGLKENLAMHEITPSAHYQSSGRNEGRASGLEGVEIDFRARTTLPEWISGEMNSQSYFEPGLDTISFPSPLHYSPLYKNDWALGIEKVAQYLRHTKYDYAFFLPWLKKGGADLASLYHIMAVSNRGSRVVVFLTENTDSEWLQRLPPEVDAVPFGKLFASANLHCQAQLVYHLISALAVKRTHIINSHSAWEALKRFTLPLRSLSEIYVSLYCYDYTEIGEPVGYARHIRSCIDGVSGIYTDNTSFKDHLSDDLGIERDIIHVLPHPVHNRPAAKPYPHLSKKVLWASRLDRQKQPNLLIEIAKRMPSVTFDVYGSAVVEQGDQVLQRLKAMPNIIYKGEFSNPSELTKDQYRCFLYTSAWDGLPNILLEMLWAGMTVIAPDVGGIKADLGSKHCIIVNDTRSPDAYVRALQWVIKNPGDAEQIRLAGQAYVKERHTNANFEKVLEGSGYFE